MPNKMVKMRGILRDLNFENIFECDKSIRFVGVCNTQGQLLDVQYRDGIVPLLSDRGLQFAAMKSAIRATTRIGDNEDVGNPICSVTTYENVKRATIPFGQDLLLITSFEKNQEESKIMEKILDILNNYQ